MKERDVEQMHNADQEVDRDNAFVQGNFPTEIRILDAPIRMLPLVHPTMIVRKTSHAIEIVVNVSTHAHSEQLVGLMLYAEL